MKHFRLLIPFIFFYFLFYSGAKFNAASISALISIFVISLYSTFKKSIAERIKYNRIVMLIFLISALIGYFIFENPILSFLSLLLLIIIIDNEYDIFKKKKS